MNDLIEIKKESIGGEAVNAVNARDLWRFLGNKKQFADWIKPRLDKFVKDVDYVRFSPVSEKPQGGRPAMEYVVSLRMAKHIAMMEKTEQGVQVRDYFIRMELIVQTEFYQQIPKTLPEAYRKLAEMEEQKAIMAPKAEVYDALMSSEDLVDMSEFVKAADIGFGRNTAFRVLRELRVLRPNNQPYQDYVSRGYFKLVEQPFTRGGEQGINIKTMITAKGQEYLIKLFDGAKSVEIQLHTV